MKALVVILLGLIISGSGCADKKTVYKYYDKTENWTIESSLTWDYTNYVTKIIIKYNGQDPLQKVEVKPIFHEEYWPQGYKPPNRLVYTWRSDNLEGQLPTPDDLSQTFSGKRSEQGLNVLTRQEANEILENSEISIGWTDFKGKEFNLTIKGNDAT